jgi:putative thioredoxin
MSSEYVISVSELDFEYEVINYSRQVPVVVDFWAGWCAPCRTLSPILERLAEEGQGAFRLAKVDVDDNPNLALRYNVRSLPTVKVFRDGEVVSEFVGALPEPRVREFLRALAHSQTDLVLEKAISLLAEQEYRLAEAAFRQFLTKVPNHSGATLGLIKCLVMTNRPVEAQQMIRSFPASKEYNSAELLRTLADALASLSSAPSYSDDPLQAAFQNAMRLVQRNNLPGAMDGLLDILRQDKNYRNGEVRRVLLGLFEILGEDHPQTRQYRGELASVLF